MLKIAGVSKVHQAGEVQTTALDRIDLEIGAGEYRFEGQNVAGWSEAKLNQLRRQRVGAMLERLGIGHRATHRPSQLSGGQQQRVAIARALVAGPAMLLADEPTGNLDSAHGDEVMRLLRDINAEGTTVVMVTHSPSHAAQASRTLHLLDGRIVVDALQAA